MLTTAFRTSAALSAFFVNPLNPSAWLNTETIEKLTITPKFLVDLGIITREEALEKVKT